MNTTHIYHLFSIFLTIFLFTIVASPCLSAEREPYPLHFLPLLLSDQCIPDCSSQSCGDDDGCGNTCIVQSCGSDERCNINGQCVIGSIWDQVTERFGGTNRTLDYPGVMQMAWFGEYSGDGNADSKILYHYDNGERRNIVYIDVSAIVPGTEIIKAEYVMPFDTEDYWAFSSTSFGDGVSLYRVTDPSGTGMWNGKSISTRYKDGTRSLEWTNGGGTFFDCIDPTPVDTLYSIGRGPKQFYSFDVTSLVQEWVDAPTKNLGFTFDDSVPSDAMTDPDFKPYLQVSYFKENDDRPPQPIGLHAFYRSGQTFITWKELPYEGPFFDMLYRVYRHTRPITKENLDNATLIAEVNQNSSQNYARTEVQLRDNPSYPILHNYIIIEGNDELQDNDGLFVFTCKEIEDAYYAVTSVKEGNENRIDFFTSNSLDTPITEAVALPRAIVQNSFMLNSGNIIQEMTHWADETMSYKVGHGFNFMVNLSNDYINSPADPAPVETVLGGRSTRYYNTWTLNNGITIRPDTYMPPTPFMPFDGYKYDSLQTWWSGSSSTYKTQEKLSDGVFIPYTENRILYYIKFVQHTYNVDENRIYLRGGSMGGTGAMSLGLKHPEVFASISATVGSPNWRLNIGRVDESYTVTEEGWRNDANALWGHQAENTRHQNGTLIWNWMNAGWYLLHNMASESPFLEMNNGKRDTSVKHFPIPKFYKDIKDSKHGLAARFYDGGHSGYGSTFTPRFGTIVRNESFPALSDVSIDDNPGAIDAATGVAIIDDFTTLTFNGDLAGTINGYFDIEWSRKRKEFSTNSSEDDMIDHASHYELALRLEDSASVNQATADITPRRLQAFKVVPGNTYLWKNKSLTSKTIIQNSSVVADQYGLITIPDFIIEKQTLGNKLIIDAQ